MARSLSHQRTHKSGSGIIRRFDGTEIDFKTSDNPEYVGTVVADNLWEALHKIGFGQPGVGMIALAALDMQTLVDILAYT